MTQTQRMQATHAKPRAAKESARWEQLALRVSAALPAGVAAVHVMDQEADDYDVLAALQTTDLRYVIRASPRRRTADRTSVAAALATPATLFRTVALTPRRPRESARTKGRHPVRAEREATLQVRWQSITLRRQCRTASAVRTLPVWAVHVWEPAPPARRSRHRVDALHLRGRPHPRGRGRGRRPLPRAVDHRGVLQSAENGLRLRDAAAHDVGRARPRARALHSDGVATARAPPSGPRRNADALGERFDQEQLLLLRRLLARRRYHMPPQPTMRDAMLGIAALGGHITNNGDPGWLVLGRGLSRFLEAELGWHLAREEM